MRTRTWLVLFIAFAGLFFLLTRLDSPRTVVHAQQCPQGFTLTGGVCVATVVRGATGASGATGAAGATGVINVAQTDATASRAIGTVYQNLTGGTMFVSIIIGNSSNTGLFSCFSDSSSTPNVIVSKTTLSGTFQSGSLATCFFAVPNNYYYKITVPTSAALSKWFEWN